MGTTEVTYVTNNYGITEEELHEILKKERANFNKVIKKLEKQKDGFKENIKNQEIYINNLNNEIRNLEREYKNEISNMEKEHEREIKEKDKKNKELGDKLDKTKERLKAAVNSYKIAQKKSEELENQLDLEKKKSNEYLNKWIKTKNELMDEKQKNIELEEKNAVKDEIINFLEGELKELSGKCEQQKEEIENLTKNFLSQINQLKNDVSELKISNENLKGSIDRNNDLMATMRNDMKRNEESHQKEKEEMNKKMEGLNSNMNLMMNMMQQLLQKDK